MTCPRCNDTGDNRYWEGRWRDEKIENERLQLENWQLKGALGYSVPGDIPQGDYKCGMCLARAASEGTIAPAANYSAHLKEDAPMGNGNDPNKPNPNPGQPNPDPNKPNPNPNQPR